MGLIADLLTALFILPGALLVLVGGIGVMRMPDFYTRLHAAGITDTLGAGLILVGLLFQGGFTLISVKLLMILGFLLFTSPTASHALSRAALADKDNPPPILSPDPDANSEDSSSTSS